MSDYGRSASRGAQAGTPSAPGRTRLGKQHWQDIRRARKLGADGGLHSVDLHGVRLTFRFQSAYCGPAQHMATPRAAQEGQAAGGSAAKAQRPPTTPPRPSDVQRPRRGKGVQGSTRPSKPGYARTTADEDAGSASRATAGETAGAGTTTAQSPSVCSPRRPNSRQRRSANRLVEYIRSKQGPHPAAAESPQTATPERASPKRTREDGVPNDSGITDRSVARRSRTVVEIDHEARQEAAAALYRAWRQQVLEGTAASSTALAPASSPKRALDNGAQEGKSKQRQLARSWRHQPAW
jgi:hypothetical protein